MKTTLPILLLFAFVISSAQLSAQGETAHWYFGYGYGMNFIDMNSVSNATINGVPNQTLADVPSYESGPINTWEGCFSISDSEGNYLFSSDGTYVYNDNQQFMPHGRDLLGNSSAAQSGIVLPRPGHSRNYYIVTVPSYDAERNPIMYYEVDLDEDGGHGDVLGPYTGEAPNGTALNFGGIYDPNYPNENLATIGHDNGIDYWLVHRLREHIFVWLVTEDGIDPTPTHNIHIPASSAAIYDNRGGYLKFSPDGRYLGGATYGSGRHVFVSRFDAETGLITDICCKETNERPYTFSFSPDGNYLYYVLLYGANPPQRVSVQSIFDGTSETPYELSALQKCNNLQLGFDNRLYGMRYVDKSRELYIILNPDDPNPVCAVIPDFFPANGIKPFLGLPTFSSTFFSTQGIEISPETPCMQKTVTFSVQITPGSGTNRVARLDWDFGDGSPTVTDTEMNQPVYTHDHTYYKDGLYTLTITPYKADGTPLANKVQTLDVRVKPCVMPVNPNIHLY